MNNLTEREAVALDEAKRELATPKWAQINRTVALAIVAAVALAAVVALIVALTAEPAHGQTITPANEPQAPAEMHPVLWMPQISQPQHRQMSTCDSEHPESCAL